MEKDIDLLARTAWGEARGEGVRGMQAVMNVIMNRAKQGGWWGDSIETVVKKRLQFSAWNENDPNRERMLTVNESDPWFRAALDLAKIAVRGELADITGGATHYHTTSINPTWADASKVTAQIGNHVFYGGLG